jgi:preprotein translocase subunit SecG
LLKHPGGENLEHPSSFLHALFFGHGILLLLYREKVAEQRQKQLIDELLQEETLNEQRNAKKARDLEHPSSFLHALFFGHGILLLLLANLREQYHILEDYDSQEEEEFDEDEMVRVYDLGCDIVRASLLTIHPSSFLHALFFGHGILLLLLANLREQYHILDHRPGRYTVRNGCCSSILPWA